MAITNWPKTERPREKLLLHGAKYLSDAEILAILLRIGTKGLNALDLARSLLSEYGNLKTLLNTHPQRLYQQTGLGKAKCATLLAAIELGQRFLDHSLAVGEVLSSSLVAKQFLAKRLRDYPHEVFACLFLDNQQRIIGYEELFNGTINQSPVYPREVMKRGLAHNAAKVILAHNHPSGDQKPSQADKEITQLLKESLAIIDISVIDHIIIGHHENLSFMEAGYI